MSKLSKIICTLLFISVLPHSDIIAQGNADYNTYKMPLRYQISSGRNGLTLSAFQVTARVEIVRYNTNAKILLNINAEQSTPSNPDPTYLFSYTYQGKQYGDAQIDQNFFSSVKTSGLKYEATVKYKSRSWTKEMSSAASFDDVDKDIKATDVVVYLKIVDAGFFEGKGDIEARIRSILKATAEENNSPALPSSNSNPDYRAIAGSGKSAPQSMNEPRNTAAARNPNSTAANNKPSATNGTVSKNTAATRNPNSTADNSAKSASQGTNEPGNAAGTTAANTRTSERRESVNAGKSVGEAILTGVMGELQVLAARNAQEKHDKAVQDLYDRTEAEDRATRHLLDSLNAEEKRKSDKAERIKMINDLYSKYGNGNVPRSAASNINEVYFFSFGQGEGNSESMFVSNVFPVARYGDGTWPFKDRVIADISIASKGKNIQLSKPFTSVEKAAEELTALKLAIGEGDLIVSSITYKGKPSTSSKSTDFGATPNINSKKDANDDFWQTGKKTDAKTPATTNADAGNKKAEVDFWGVPVKQDTTSKKRKQ